VSLGAVTNKTRIVRPTALRVREILENIQITSHGKSRTVKPGDICVLVTSRNTGASIESALREMGVSAVSSGTENVMQGEMATALYNLLRAMDEPYETSRIRLAAASPFFGASLANAGAIDDETVEQIRRTIAIWGTTLRRRGVAALAAVLRADLDIAARIVQGGAGERRETDFAHVIELLHSATLGVGCSPSVVLNSFNDFSQLEPQSEVISRRVESDKDAVQIMTVHAAKGLEFPVVVVADLWKKVRAKNSKKPSPDTFYRESPTNSGEREHVIDATYVISRAFDEAKEGRKQEESEEVKRLFYVALTRAEHQAYLTYAQSRYRWGKLTDSEPSRFVEEIDSQYLEYLTPAESNYRYKPMIDNDIFGDIDKSKLRLAKPVSGTPPKYITDNQPKPDSPIRRLKPVTGNAPNSSNANLFDNKLVAGNIVMHERFGKGEVINMEGVGADRKAEIRFEVGGIKKLLLRFAKLEIIG
jgi:ATP-dependent exoDNAse (exonuclease V) beta subunit